MINFSEQQLLAGEQQDEKPVEDDEDDEEGAIRDPGTELVSTSSPILQVLYSNLLFVNVSWSMIKSHAPLCFSQPLSCVMVMINTINMRIH